MFTFVGTFDTVFATTVRGAGGRGGEGKGGGGGGGGRGSEGGEGGRGGRGCCCNTCVAGTNWTLPRSLWYCVKDRKDTELMERIGTAVA